MDRRKIDFKPKPQTYHTIDNALLTSATATGAPGDVDWDEVGNEYDQPPRQFALCHCLYALFGMKTSSQALFDARVHLRNLIHSKEQKMNSAEFARARAVNDLLFYKRAKNFTGAKVAMSAKKSAERRMENIRIDIANFEEKLHTLDDMHDSKESTEALKQIGKNMKHLNLPKRLRDAESARDTIASNACDMEELQTILKPLPVYDGVSVQMTEAELEEEVKAYFAQSDDEETEERVVPSAVPKSWYHSQVIERTEPETASAIPAG